MYNNDKSEITYDYLNKAKADTLISVFDGIDITPNVKILDGRWLEIGCMSGRVVHELVKNGIEAYGFDVSKYSIRHAPLEVVDRVKCADGINSKLYGCKQFDVIYSFETAEHVAQKDVARWIRNIKYWLKDGGYLFMTIRLGHSYIRGTNDNDELYRTLRPRKWWNKRFNKVWLWEIDRTPMLYNKAMNTVVNTPHGGESILHKYDMNLFVRKTYETP